MAYNDKDFIQEDVLFTNAQSDVDTEVLFKPGVAENLEYQEPKAFSANNAALSEEVLKVENEDVFEEKLFSSSGIEDGLEPLSTETLSAHQSDVGSVLESPLAVEEDEYFIQEESITFKEPVRPEFVSEEVLFPTAEEEVISSDVSGAPSIISDELSALGEMKSKDIVLGTGANQPKYVEKNFAEKLLHADYEIIKRYEELKNYILTYKDVKSRVSNDFDSFNMGRTQLFKLGYSTKSLKLYLNLEFDKVEPRLKCKDVSHKKAYAQVPVFLRIKSPRALKNAKYLINQVAERFNLKENPKATFVDAVKILRTKAKTYD